MATLQNRLFFMEEKQVQLIYTMETNQAKEISVMKANQVTFIIGWRKWKDYRYKNSR